MSSLKSQCWEELSDNINSRRIIVDVANGKDYQALLYGSFDNEEPKCDPCNEPLFPVARQVRSQLLGTELVEVKPLPMPGFKAEEEKIRARLPRKTKKMLKSAFGDMGYKMWLKRNSRCNMDLPSGMLFYMDARVDWGD